MTTCQHVNICDCVCINHPFSEKVEFLAGAKVVDTLPLYTYISNSENLNNFTVYRSYCFICKLSRGLLHINAKRGYVIGATVSEPPLVDSTAALSQTTFVRTYLPSDVFRIVTLVRYDDGYRMYRAMRDKEPAAHRLAVQVLP